MGALRLGWQVHPKTHLAMETARAVLPDLLGTTKAGVLLNTVHLNQSKPLLLATWVEIASIRAGDRQS